VRRLVDIGGVAFGFAALLVVTFTVTGALDYDYQVAPAMNALLQGDLHRFFELQPVYGGFSVLARLPFAFVARLADGGEMLVYQFGVVPCAAALAVAVGVVTKSMREAGQAVGARIAVGALLLVNPATFAAVQRGHPEELLTVALVLGATLAAIRSRPLLAAVLLGLALGTKQWALLAVVPVLLVCGPGHRLRAALVAAALAGALVAPLALANPDRFAQNNRAAEGGWAHASRLSIWWPLGSAEEVRRGNAPGESFTIRRLPTHLTPLARPAVVLAAAALSFAFWYRRRRERVAEDIVGLLALFLLLRCVFDPLNNDYYHAPLLVFLIAWEALRVRGLPVLGLIAAAGLWANTASPWLSREALGDDFYTINNAVYLAWIVPLGAWLAVTLFRRREVTQARPRRREPRLGLKRTWISGPQSSAS
jgi:hypothetical protein